MGTVKIMFVHSRAIAEIAPLGADILVTVGPEGEPAALGDVPDNVRVERFVAQSPYSRWSISSCITAAPGRLTRSPRCLHPPMW